jgi:hypothetical protein
MHSSTVQLGDWLVLWLFKEIVRPLREDANGIQCEISRVCNKSSYLPVPVPCFPLHGALQSELLQFEHTFRALFFVWPAAWGWKGVGFRYLADLAPSLATSSMIVSSLKSLIRSIQSRS